MNTKKFPLTIESDTLNAFKADFNQMLRRLLTMMESQEAEEGTLNAKIVVKLEQDKARDYQANNYDGTRDITKPTFNHKVGIAMQFRDEKSGTLGGNYEMVWDKELNSYVMVEINNGQTSLFEKEEECNPNDEPETSESKSYYEMGKELVNGFADCLTDAKQINGRTIGAFSLPAPENIPDDTEIIDAEYTTEVADESADDDLVTMIDEFEYATKFIGTDMKILHSGGDLYSVRTIKRGVVFLASAGTVKSPFYVAPEVCAKHVDHEVICTSEIDERSGKIVRILVKCIECDEVIWFMNNSEDYHYEKPEG